MTLKEKTLFKSKLNDNGAKNFSLSMGLKAYGNKWFP